MIRGILRVVGLTIVVILLVSVAFVGGYGSSRLMFPPPLPADGGAPADWQPSFKVFWEAWNYVHQDFYKPNINDSELVNSSIAGMVQALGDTHTAFVDAKQAAISSTSLTGSFEGIGATVEMREGRLTIVTPIKGSPAEKAGLLPNDVVLQVNDTVIQNMDVTQAVTLIRGPKGSKVKLLIQRSRVPNFTVEIVRDTIRTPFVESRMLEGTNIAYLRLNDFGATAPEEIQAALRELLAQNPTGLVFDLRNDPGGYLSVSIDVASQFLKGSQVVLVEKDKDGRSQEFRAKGNGLATNIPMVLLINGGSASASEIVAAALKDYNRASLIGTKSYGKGSVQNVHTLSDKSELRVTIAHFFSPKGNEINEVGVSPDIEVKVTEDDIANKRDPQLDRAIQFLQNGK
ncbi:MAG: S41 family peptidase [Chloroflexi bacterium]|nr:S41 family peptidase [Chloroflexota bacterium]